MLYEYNLDAVVCCPDIFYPKTSLANGQGGGSECGHPFTVITEAT